MNAIIKQLEQNKGQLSEWFEHIHSHPELSMQEANTAKYIEETLRSFGEYEVEAGVGKYGIVATLKVGDGDQSIGIRADFDALPIQESNDLHYCSKEAGVSHLCGHDGHTTMLLAAAKHLAETKNFNGTLRLFFQPAEETMQGAPAMIEDGLFERFPVDSVFAMHNMPGLEQGKLYFTEGNVMAAVDNWEVVLTGKGGHGAFPELAIDPVVAGSSLVMAIQSIVARNVSPANSAVVTIGAFQAGEAGNVIAQTATLRMSVRTTTDEDRSLVLNNIRRLVQQQAESFGCTAEIHEGQPGAVAYNDPEETRKAAQIAREAFGEENVFEDGPTYLASEDFAFMLQKCKGTYCFLGNGDSKFVHHPEYVFNQDILPIGAAYWVAIAEGYLR
ncbi:hippurate hydrolase [Oceanisphaera litoralis]|uniref:M20 aminoacylase family protein n=1 Tax=Oceanisphaera litoralis TaxID=225144 RepID=UPI00195D0608|nr:M20 aminoacylase family protein [Oceanisphaera litoralis]MBM7454898.1 hippurate hydrolase [Oceanisphaera litoralis]